MTHNPEIDLEAFRAAPAIASARQATRGRGRRQLFLKGPVPLDWLKAAGQLPGRALHVAVVLQFLYGFRQSDELVLSQRWLSVFGVKRHSAYRALRALEKAGLVLVTRQAGHAPRVEVIHASVVPRTQEQTSHDRATNVSH